MDTHPRFRLAALLAVTLAGAWLDDGATAPAFARQAFRATTQLIHAVAPPPPAPAPISMTTGVRG